MVGLALSGCLPPQPKPAAPDDPMFSPESFFEGSTAGSGILHIRGRSPESVQVESVGTFQPDGVFRLDQRIVIGDDPPRNRSWTMQRDSSGEYDVTLSDAAGPVTLVVNGSELLIRYRMGSVTRMSQRLVLRPDGQSAMNHATVTVLGIPWARLEEEIVRVRE